MAVCVSCGRTSCSSNKRLAYEIRRVARRRLNIPEHERLKSTSRTKILKNMRLIPDSVLLKCRIEAASDYVSRSPQRFCARNVDTRRIRSAEAGSVNELLVSSADHCRNEFQAQNRCVSSRICFGQELPGQGPRVIATRKTQLFVVGLAGVSTEFEQPEDTLEEHRDEC